MNGTSDTPADAIPVLSDVVIPGTPPSATPAPVPPPPTPDLAELTERLHFQAAALLAEMEHRIERMVEEELARAHATALETARLSLQHRLHDELEARLAELIEGLRTP